MSELEKFAKRGCVCEGNLDNVRDTLTWTMSKIPWPRQCLSWENLLSRKGGVSQAMSEIPCPGQWVGKICFAGGGGISDNVWDTLPKGWICPSSIGIHSHSLSLAFGYGWPLCFSPQDGWMRIHGQTNISAADKYMNNMRNFSVLSQGRKMSPCLSLSVFFRLCVCVPHDEGFVYTVEWYPACAP